MNGQLFDTHAHYHDDRFRTESAGAERLLNEIFSEGVETIVNVGTNHDCNRACLRLAMKYPRMVAALGLYPEDCEGYEEKDLFEFESYLVKGMETGKVVAIGEIGLDYHVEGYNREKQLTFFEAQMRLAEKYDLPVIIHDREAHGDCFDMIRKYDKVRGVFHSYSGSAEMAKDLCRRGWYISFSGVLTFKNAVKVREAAAAVPMDKLLLETDCPYLAPHPMRGQLNHSGYLHYTAEMLASVKGVTPGEMADVTSLNAHRLFRI